MLMSAGAFARETSAASGSPRVNAGARQNDISYSRLMHGLKVAGINLNRKMLADLAVNDVPAFASLCEKAKTALNKRLSR